MLELTCNYIDTCYPDYLLDHHNRDNEILLSAYPDEDKDFIATQLFQSYCETERIIEINGEVITDRKVKLAIDEMVEQLHTKQIMFYLDSLDDESPIIYAYLTW